MTVPGFALVFVQQPWQCQWWSMEIREGWPCLDCVPVLIHLPCCPVAHPHLLPSVHSRHETVHAPAWWYSKPSALNTSVPSQRGKCPPSIRRNYSFLVILLLQSCLSQDSWGSNLSPPVPLKPCYSHSDLGVLFCPLETAVLTDGNEKTFINSILKLENFNERS